MSLAATAIAGAREHAEAGRFAEAKAALRMALRRSPRDADLNNAMANVLVKAGDGPRAVYFAEAACSARPGDPLLLATLGNALGVAGEADKAASAFERSLASGSAPPAAYIGLCNVRQARRRFEDSADACRAGLARFAGHPGLVATAITALVECGLADEAMELVRAHAAGPDADVLAVQAAAFASNYASGLDRREIFDLHARYGRAVESALGPPPRPPPADPAPDRRLRVAYLSPDFRRHSVSHFAEPLVQHHDRDRFEVWCYSTVARPDAVTDRFRGLADRWVDAAAMDLRALARRIAADRIDVLVELSGHTASHRLPVMALRPAPVQVTAIGYPNTTGLSAIDARLVDDVTDPPGDADELATERLERVDGSFLCYRPFEGAPDAGPPPCGGAGPVTFGCFNTIAKFNRPLLDLWRRVLDATPSSRLILKAGQLEDARLATRLASSLAAAGLGPDRVTLVPPVPDFAGHLALYGRVDIGLDTYPYHGTTTTAEAMWMGVPVLTLAGDRHAARVGPSLCRSVGLPEVVAGSEDDFVTRAASLAADRPRLASIRASLRARFAASRLCDGPAHARAVEAIYRRLWGRAIAASATAGPQRTPSR